MFAAYLKFQWTGHHVFLCGKSEQLQQRQRANADSNPEHLDVPPPAPPSCTLLLRSGLHGVLPLRRLGVEKEIEGSQGKGMSGQSEEMMGRQTELKSESAGRRLWRLSASAAWGTRLEGCTVGSKLRLRTPVFQPFRQWREPESLLEVNYLPVRQPGPQQRASQAGAVYR